MSRCCHDRDSPCVQFTGRREFPLMSVNRLSRRKCTLVVLPLRGGSLRKQMVYRLLYRHHQTPLTETFSPRIVHASTTSPLAAHVVQNSAWRVTLSSL